MEREEQKSLGYMETEKRREPDFTMWDKSGLHGWRCGIAWAELGLNSGDSLNSMKKTWETLGYVDRRVGQPGVGGDE